MFKVLACCPAHRETSSSRRRNHSSEFRKFPWFVFRHLRILPSSLIRFNFHHVWIFPVVLAGHFRTCSCFPIRFIIAYRFRLLSSSGSDISGLARLPPDPLRILSFPDVTVFHLRTFPLFPSSSRFASCSTSSGYFFHIRKFPDVSVFPNRFFFHSCRMLPSF